MQVEPYNFLVGIKFAISMFLHVTTSGITSSLYRKIILNVRFGCGLFIESSVSIYSSKWLHQETACYYFQFSFCLN